MITTIESSKAALNPPFTDAQLKSRVKLVLQSTGVKHNVGAAKKGFISLPRADFYVDCRGVAERGLHEKGTGKSLAFQAAVETASPAALTHIHASILEAIAKVPDRRRERPDPFTDPFTICFFCAWGMHRSVATKYIMGERLRRNGYLVTIEAESIGGYWETL